MRISIIGNCGSGKSTLATKISQKFNIPHLHLDRLWFGGGGHLLKRDDSIGKEKVRNHVQQQVLKFIAQEDWVSDGWYKQSQVLIAERADQLVFLDIPLYRRTINHFYRIFFSKRHPELSLWDDLKFTTQIIKRTFTHGAQMKEFVDQYEGSVIRLRTYKEVDRFFANLR